MHTPNERDTVSPTAAATPAEEFELITSLTRELTGIVLGPAQSYLIESRLGPLLTEHSCDNLNELYFRIKYGGEASLRDAMIDAITTNETQWFRDPAVFEALQFKVLPERIDARQAAGQRTLRIWSAACSTGQEPYGLAMLLHDLLRDQSGWHVEIVASDISKSALARARAGVYTRQEAERSQRAETTRRHLQPKGDAVEVPPELRRMVRFEQRNLLQDGPPPGTFDAVLMRNVLIYFDSDQRQLAVQQARTALDDGGWLFLGAAEALEGTWSSWQPQTHCRATVYHAGDAPTGTDKATKS